MMGIMKVTNVVKNSTKERISGIINRFFMGVDKCGKGVQKDDGIPYDVFGFALFYQLLKTLSMSSLIHE